VLFKAAYNYKQEQIYNTCLKSKYKIRLLCNTEEEVVVHYRTIAFKNQIIKNAKERDRVSADLGGVLYFEMKAAGLINSFLCLVVCSICDYADLYKNK
jgi:hypothetical protein